MKAGAVIIFLFFILICIILGVLEETTRKKQKHEIKKLELQWKIDSTKSVNSNKK